MASTKLSIDDVSMTFATPAGVFHALDHIDLAVLRGSFVSLIGPSGCGKSTIFNIVAGLQEPSAGRVLIDGVCCCRGGRSPTTSSSAWRSRA